jgi:nucleoside-diphosphate-sugar epimerase
MARVQDIEKDIRWFAADSSGGVDSAAFVDIDTVIHTATAYGRRGETNTAIALANMLFPLTVLEGATQAGVRRFINTDTIVPRATNAYSLSKAQFVEWGRLLAGTGISEFINIRLEHLYGPGDDESKFSCYVINACLRNQSELHLTAGTQKRDFIYVADAVEAYAQVVRQSEAIPDGFVEIPVGSGLAIPVREFVETIHQMAHSSTRLLFGALPTGSDEVLYSCADLTKMKGLRWKPVTALRDGLEITIRSDAQR